MKNLGKDGPVVPIAGKKARGALLPKKKMI